MSQIEALAWLLCAPNSTHKLLMFGAYFDDSGVHPTARVRVFAGYLASMEEWKPFEVKWRDLLNDAGVPYFRAYDCVRGENTFKDRPEAERQEHYRRAVEIITKRDLLGVAVIGKHDKPGEGWLERRESDPLWAGGTYLPVIQHCLYMTGENFSQRWPGERASVVIEQGSDPDMELCWNAYLKLKEKWDPYEKVFDGSPAFRGKRDYLQLQAADLFAYEVGREDYRRYFNRETEPNPRPEWEALQRHAHQGGGGLYGVVHTSPWRRA